MTRCTKWCTKWFESKWYCAAALLLTLLLTGVGMVLLSTEIARADSGFAVDSAGIVTAAQDSAFMGPDGRVVFALTLNYTYAGGKQGSNVTEYTSACDRDQAQEFLWNCLLPPNSCPSLTIYYHNNAFENTSSLVPFSLSDSSSQNIALLVVSVMLCAASLCGLYWLDPRRRSESGCDTP